MSKHPGTFTVAAVASAVCLAANAGVSAMAQGTPKPDFAPNPSTTWFSYSRDFIAPPTGPGPVLSDPAHPHVSNDEFRATGKQATVPVADLSNPILQPWSREKLRQRNDLVLAGKRVFSQHATCWPIGVTAFLLEPMTRPMYFVQAPKEVVMILTSYNDVRHIYLTDKHSENLQPTWYGESIGHYDGSSLLVDTIGFNDRTYMDGFQTPHTTQLHVAERLHLIKNGEELEANVHVEDPGAFTMPWDAIVRYRRYEAIARAAAIAKSLVQLATPDEGPLTEARCAENPNSFMGMPHPPLPQAEHPDF
jgi:hypothetical protein